MSGERELPRASLIEGLRFTAQVMVPNLVQGLFRRRRRAVGAATRLNVDGHAVGLIRGLRKSHGPGPLWIRAGTDQMVLLTEADDNRLLLEGSPDPYAPDPDAKRRGMGHFQPDALTLSRGELWRNRRRFAEAVLDTGRVHRLADRFVAAGREEAGALADELAGRLETQLDWDAFHLAGRRTARRVILGDAARDDEELTDLLASMMGAANGLPKEPSDKLDEFLARVRAYIANAEEGSLVSLFGDAPADAETKTDRQVTHWIFALGDTLPANAFRALALIASHPHERAKVIAELEGAGDALATGEGVAGLGFLDGCLHEAMRLYPTTPFLSRESLIDTRWEGETVPAGTQFLISNTFNHRDPHRREFADRFAPEAWTEGDAARDWSFNHFSNGPQGCPGAGIAMLAGKALLAELLSTRRIELLHPSIDPEPPLPHMLDYFAIRFALA